MRQYSYRRLLSLLLLIVGVFSSITWVEAQENYSYVHNAGILDNRTISDMCSDSVEDLFGLSEKYYYTEEEFSLKDPRYVVCDLILSAYNINFTENGQTIFVDAIVRTEDNKYVNVSEFAEWESSNINIASVHHGKIYSRGKGVVEITVSYGNCEKEIIVEVENEVDLLSNISKLARGSNTAYQRALDIYYQTWSPTSDIYQWDEYDGSPTKFFEAGTTYSGYPYTQYGDCYPTSYLGGRVFSNVINNTNFLRLTVRTISVGNENKDYYCPYYGIDCSGLVCYSLNTSTKYSTSMMISAIGSGTFNKVGSYNTTSPTATDLKQAYNDMTAGDALVTSGHCFLVMSNDTVNKTVLVVEQTPPLTCVTTYTYTYLANNGYRPFN